MFNGGKERHSDLRLLLQGQKEEGFVREKHLPSGFFSLSSRRRRMNGDKFIDKVGIRDFPVSAESHPISFGKVRRAISEFVL